MPPHSAASAISFSIRDYDLAATLGCGQAFRWRKRDGVWEGVIGARWVRLRQDGKYLHAETAVPTSDWSWLRDYLQLDVDIAAVLATFPDDAPMRAAVQSCRGLRLLRQPLWECLAGFISSSNKQIVQIAQINHALAERLGERVPVLPGASPAFVFPSAAHIVDAGVAPLRDCKLGYRAPYLLQSARMVAGGEVDLAAIKTMSYAVARAELMRLPGVGPKVADCVLLFGYGFPEAFPVDVWVMRALRELYFPRRKPTAQRLTRFAHTHFGPHAGYAQQYLFHYMRTR